MADASSLDASAAPPPSPGRLPPAAVAPDVVVPRDACASGDAPAARLVLYTGASEWKLVRVVRRAPSCAGLGAFAALWRSSRHCVVRRHAPARLAQRSQLHDEYEIASRDGPAFEFNRDFYAIALEVDGKIVPFLPKEVVMMTVSELLECPQETEARKWRAGGVASCTCGVRCPPFT